MRHRAVCCCTKRTIGCAWSVGREPGVVAPTSWLQRRHFAATSTRTCLGIGSFAKAPSEHGFAHTLPRSQTTWKTSVTLTLESSSYYASSEFLSSKLDMAPKKSHRLPRLSQWWYQPRARVNPKPGREHQSPREGDAPLTLPYHCGSFHRFLEAASTTWHAIDGSAARILGESHVSGCARGITVEYLGFSMQVVEWHRRSCRARVTLRSNVDAHRWEAPSTCGSLYPDQKTNTRGSELQRQQPAARSRHAKQQSSPFKTSPQKGLRTNGRSGANAREIILSGVSLFPGPLYLGVTHADRQRKFARV